MPSELLCDKQVARLLSLSDSWVRVQRWKRRTNQEHVFTINPIMIGASPRYRLEDVENWIEALNGNEEDEG